MSLLRDQLAIERDVPVRTWFGIGGVADHLARPTSVDALRACFELDPELVVLGDGANLLVDDDGMDRLVVSLDAPTFAAVRGVRPGDDGVDKGARLGVVDAAGEVRVLAGAGAKLPKLIVEAVRYGLEGVEGLSGIPASLGGAVRMNAGGSFGQIADVVRRVEVVERDGTVRDLARGGIAFDYRRSGLEGCVVTSVELGLRPAESPTRLRAAQLAVMARKKRTQPMGAESAGCCFKNPTLARDVDGIGAAGDRVPAGLLIDRAGGKGMREGGATVSDRHANFITATRGARARDVITLMERVEALVAERFGVSLEREVVVWSRGGQ